MSFLFNALVRCGLLLFSSVGDAESKMLQPEVQTFTLSLLCLEVLFGLGIAQRLLILLLTGLKQRIACLSEFVLQIKAHHSQLSLRLGELFDLLTVLLVLTFHLEHMLQRLLEKLDCIDEDSFLRLLLDYEVDNL